MPSARKVAWLSDRTRPFALVLVQSDDPADTPLGPFIIAGGISRGNGSLYLILGRIF